ncbi:MAG TPA: glycosyltransferase family 39 protein, partial [Thermodesulfobacteriota bacterium]|nr:glycosyltransferase family 39 protein [Thermodesulfobacteriota bacterium]
MSAAQVAHVAAAAAIAGAGIALRAINLGGPAFGFDEFYDVFAARSWLAGEGFHLPYGPYTRGRLATLLTAAAFALFGESEATARLPALLFGSLALPLAYGAGRILFGPTAGLLALFLVAFSPDAIDASRFARLYSLLTFLTLLGALAAFRALEGNGADGPRLTPARLGWLALAAAATLVGAHLHPVALGLPLAVQAYAGVLGVGLAVRRRYPLAARYGVLVAGFIVLEALALVVRPGLGAMMLDRALTALPWYTPQPGDVLVYHRHLANQYAWLWALVWPATVVVVLTRPRAGLFTALVFWLPFGILSGLVATKHPRYLLHLLPFAWLLLAGAAGLLWPTARAALLARVRPHLPASVPPRLAVAAVVGVAALPVLRLTPSVVAAMRRPGQTTGTFFATNHFYDWRTLSRALAARL